MYKFALALGLVVMTGATAFALNDEQLTDFKAGLVRGCETSMTERNKTENMQLSDETIKKFCHCSSETAGKEFAKYDADTILEWTKNPTSEFQDIVNGAAQTCAAQFK